MFIAEQYFLEKKSKAQVCQHKQQQAEAATVIDNNNN